MSETSNPQSELYRLVQQREDIFDFLQTASLDGVWLWDLERPGQERPGPGFWALLGYAPGERVPTWQDAILPEDLPDALVSRERLRTGEDESAEQILRFRHRDGSTVWLRCRRRLVRDERGRPFRVLSVHTDLTALKRTEAALQQSSRELQDFAAATSHDLRAPLRAISGFSSLLTESLGDRLSEQERFFLSRINNAVGSMSALIDDLLAYARLDSDRGRSGVDLAATVAGVEEALAARLAESGGRIRCRSLPTVTADPVMMRQLMLHLVDNALRYRHPERVPEVVIAAEATVSGWRISVSDNGAGIDERFHRRIFELFQKLQPGEGTGIGLALCDKIVRLHGGTLSLTSTPGEGSTFSFTLPA